MKDKKLWFAVHFGRTYFKSPPLQFPGIMLGLIIPVLAFVAITAAIIGFNMTESAYTLAFAPLVAANIKDLRQRRADIKNEIDQVLSKVDVSAGMTNEQKTKIEDLRTQRTKNEELISLVEEQMEADKKLPTVQSVSLIKENVEDDPKGGFKDHKDFLKAIVRVPHSGEDSRLRQFRATQGSDEQQSGLDPYGGYLVPIGIAPGVLKVMPEDDPVAGLVRSVPMTAPTVGFNARVDKDHTSSVSGGLTVARIPETVDASASRMKFEQVRLVANALYGVTYATEDILTDSPESFIALLSSGFADEFASNAMNERLNGTGAGQFQGILNAGCKCQITVAKESGQTSTTIVKENIDKMIARCWRYNKAVWHANHNTRPQLASLYQLVGTTGGSVVNYFKPGDGPNGEDMLAGRPLYFTEYCAALGTVGDIVLVMWSEYLEGTYKSMQRDESIHVRFLSNERTFRFYLRNDGKPWWTSALTPKNGDTLSPVVKLATR